MRILLLCTKPPYPPHDGGSRASYNLMQSLCASGHTITLLTMCTQKHGLTDRDRDQLSSLVRLHTAYVKTAVTVNGILYNLLFSRMPYNAVRFISKSFERALIRVLQLSVFDIIQLEGLYLMPYASTIRRHSKALLVLRAHNVEQEIWMRISDQEKNPLRKWYFGLLANRIRNFETEMTGKYDLLVPITERDLDCFAEMGSQAPALVIPAGVDAAAVLPPPPETPGLFFLGSLDWKPNQEGLLWFIEKVWPSLKAAHPDLVFDVAGRNAPGLLIRKLHQPGVVFHGEVPDAAVFLRSHSILVAPCFSGGGMRVKILESLAMGRPVITTPIGAEGLGATNGEEILLCDQPDDFVRAVEELLADLTRYEKMSRKGFEFVHARFDNQTLAAMLSEFYKIHLQ
jgi:glycosyltransferase involved in cell wall biosynthesis